MRKQSLRDGKRNRQANGKRRTFASGGMYGHATAKLFYLVFNHIHPYPAS